MRISAAVLDAPDANALAAFYARLLDWTIVEDFPGWVRVRHPSGDLTPAGLSFAHQEQYVAPVWPATADAQQMMVHLDIACDDLASGVEWAIECGARLADHQPQPHVRVMLDPFGHPFCLFQGPV
jgi:catechol 2,3-dioxygenase-like lactoylglutathione lyase family enzyme